jgi:hypothetical protein
MPPPADRLVQASPPAPKGSDAVRALPPPASHLTHLGVRGCRGLTSSSLSCVLRACTALATVDGGRVGLLSSPAAAALGAHCRGLTTVRLSACGVGDEHLRALAAGLRGLHHLDVSGNAGVTDVGVVAVAVACAALRSLDLGGCLAVTGAGAGALVRAATTHAQRANLCAGALAWASQSSTASAYGAGSSLPLRGDEAPAGNALWAARRHPLVRAHACS